MLAAGFFIKNKRFNFCYIVANTKIRSFVIMRMDNLFLQNNSKNGTFPLFAFT